jgi:methylaspartate mutase epsilon subunit
VSGGGNVGPVGRTVLLAGVGGDAHFVGLTVLRTALERAGFHVVFVGAQNGVDEVCGRACGADAVLISNMDGHAKYYLDGLAEAQRELGVEDRLWYLGGYPSLTGDAEALAELSRLGFDRVFHGYVESAAVLDVLTTDLAARRPVAGVAATDPTGPEQVGLRRTEAVRGWSFGVREEVLASWSTGHLARDLAANAERLLAGTLLADRQARAGRERDILVQPRTGVADNDRQRELFLSLADAGADVLSFQIDSLTRNNGYVEVERVLKDTHTASPLNGYPAVNHGVEKLAQVCAGLWHLPLQVRHSTRDPRLLAEVSFAAGIGAFEGGPLSYNLPYFRDYPIAAAIESWQYVDELVGYYHAEHGVTIDREFFGVLTACLVPPSTAVVVNVFEALLAARAGVKAVTLGYAEQGNRAQDLAAVRVSRAITREYLAAHGFGDVAVEVVWHQYMGPFPRSAAKARQLLVGSAETAAMSEAVRLMLKTQVEAHRIPDARDNSAALALVKRTCQAVRAAPTTPLSDVDVREEQLITAEARSIVDRALAAADGDVVIAVQLAVARGWLDVPFSPSRWNAGKAMPLRDGDGAVRLARLGDLPFPPDVVDWHRAAVARRYATDGEHLDGLLEADITLTARGAFDTWPLG